MNIFNIKLGHYLKQGEIVDGDSINLDDLNMGQRFEVVTVPASFTTWKIGDIVEVQIAKDIGIIVLMNLSSLKHRRQQSLSGWMLKVL